MSRLMIPVIELSLQHAKTKLVLSVTEPTKTVRTLATDGAHQMVQLLQPLKSQILKLLRLRHQRPKHQPQKLPLILQMKRQLTSSIHLLVQMRSMSAGSIKHPRSFTRDLASDLVFSILSTERLISPFVRTITLATVLWRKRTVVTNS